MYDRTTHSRACEIRQAWSPVERYMRAVMGRSQREAFLSLLVGAPQRRDPVWSLGSKASTARAAS